MEHPPLRDSVMGGSFLGIQKDMGRRAQGTDMSVHREL